MLLFVGVWWIWDLVWICIYISFLFLCNGKRNWLDGYVCLLLWMLLLLCYLGVMWSMMDCEVSFVWFIVWVCVVCMWYWLFMWCVLGLLVVFVGKYVWMFVWGVVFWVVNDLGSVLVCIFEVCWLMFFSWWLVVVVCLWIDSWIGCSCCGLGVENCWLEMFWCCLDSSGWVCVVWDWCSGVGLLCWWCLYWFDWVYLVGFGVLYLCWLMLVVYGLYWVMVDVVVWGLCVMWLDLCWVYFIWLVRMYCRFWIVWFFSVLVLCVYVVLIIVMCWMLCVWVFVYENGGCYVFLDVWVWWFFWLCVYGVWVYRVLLLCLCCCWLVDVIFVCLFVLVVCCDWGCMCCEFCWRWWWVNLFRCVWLVCVDMDDWLGMCCVWCSVVCILLVGIILMDCCLWCWVVGIGCVVWKMCYCLCCCSRWVYSFYCGWDVWVIWGLCCNRLSCFICGLDWSIWFIVLVVCSMGCIWLWWCVV